MKTAKEPLFVLHARKRALANGKSSIRFTGFQGREVAVSFNEEGQDRFRMVLPESECYSAFINHPLEENFVSKKPINRLILAQKEDEFPLDYEHTVYEFDVPEEYNDLFVRMLPTGEVNQSTKSVKFLNGELQGGGGKRMVHPGLIGD